MKELFEKLNKLRLSTDFEPPKNLRLSLQVKNTQESRREFNMQKTVIYLCLVICFLCASCASTQPEEPLRSARCALKGKKNVVRLLVNGAPCPTLHIDGHAMYGKKVFGKYLSKHYKGKSLNVVSESKLVDEQVKEYITFFRNQGVILEGFFVPSSQSIESYDMLPLYRK